MEVDPEVAHSRPVHDRVLNGEDKVGGKSSEEGVIGEGELGDQGGEFSDSFFLVARSMIIESVGRTSISPPLHRSPNTRPPRADRHRPPKISIISARQAKQRTHQY